MSRFLRSASAIALIGLVAACSSGGSTSTPTSTAPATSATTATTAPATFVDADGQEVPVVDASDAVVVDLGFLSLDMLDLGIVPAAAAYPASVRDLVAGDLDPELGSAMKSLHPVLSDGFEVQVEKIAALDPTVVVTTSLYVKAFGPAIEQVRDIAPVIVLDAGLTWQERTEALGELFGVEEAAADVIADTDAEVEAGRAAIEAAGLAGSTVAILRLGATEVGGNLEAYVPPSFGSTVVTDLGLTQPAAELVEPAEGQTGAVARIPVSYEQLAAHDADLIVDLEVAGMTDPAAALKNPVWKTLRAVKDGSVVTAPYLIWTAPSSVSVRHAVQDILTGFGV